VDYNYWALVMGFPLNWILWPVVALAALAALALHVSSALSARRAFSSSPR